MSDDRTNRFEKPVAYLLGGVEGLNLEGEFGLALRLPPNDESQQETHSEDQAQGGDAPRSGASLHSQHAERQDECP